MCSTGGACVCVCILYVTVCLTVCVCAGRCACGYVCVSVSVSTSSVHVVFVHFVVPMGFLPWEILVAFPQGKPAATELRYPTLTD